MTGKRVQIPVNGRTIQGYLSPSASGAGPGLIVIQEYWGLVPHVESLCDRYAAAGFTALAPDLYHGESTKSPDDAGKLMMALNIDAAAADLRAAIDSLLADKATIGDRVGTVGFCMGGMLSLFAAAANPDRVAACIDYYGIHPLVHPDFAAMNAHVLGFFGDRDPMVTAEDAKQLEGRLLSLGKSIEIHVYPGAGHAFFNDTRPEAYDEAAARDSWTRSIAFLWKHLKKND